MLSQVVAFISSQPGSPFPPFPPCAGYGPDIPRHPPAPVVPLIPPTPSSPTKYSAPSIQTQKTPTHEQLHPPFHPAESRCFRPASWSIPGNLYYSTAIRQPFDKPTRLSPALPLLVCPFDFLVDSRWALSLVTCCTPDRTVLLALSISQTAEYNLPALYPQTLYASAGHHIITVRCFSRQISANYGFPATIK